jgi:GxxExxY protein
MRRAPPSRGEPRMLIGGNRVYTRLLHSSAACKRDSLRSAFDTELGCGFLEAVYRRPFAIELRKRNVPYTIEQNFPVIYKGEPTGVWYVADFVCFDDVIVELKAQKTLSPIDEAQTINYLKLAKRRRALLLNFGTPRLQWQRFVL